MRSGPAISPRRTSLVADMPRCIGGSRTCIRSWFVWRTHPWRKDRDGVLFLLLDPIRKVEQQGSQTPLCDVIVLQQLAERRIAQGSGQTRPQRLPCPRVVAQPQVTPNHVLQQPDRLTLDNLRHHVAQHGPHCIESLVRLADVRQTHVIQQDLLNDENRDRLAELRAGLHDAKAQGNDLGGEEESDDVRVVVLLDQCPDDTERGETQIFKGAGLGGGVEEWVEEERDVRLQEKTAGLAVARNALQQSKSVADTVAGLCGQRRRREQRVDRDDLLKKRRHDAETVPKHKRKVLVLFALLAELEQSVLALS